MGRTVFALFRAYHAQLQKLVLDVANKNDLIAVEEGAVRGLFTTKVDLSKRGDAFSLADRDKILEQVEAEPILVHIAQAEVGVVGVRSFVCMSVVVDGRWVGSGGWGRSNLI
jgi:vacuolar protein sorting-associated protein 52